jgi:hypothetical protein
MERDVSPSPRYVHQQPLPTSPYGVDCWPEFDTDGANPHRDIEAAAVAAGEPLHDNDHLGAGGGLARTPTPHKEVRGFDAETIPEESEDSEDSLYAADSSIATEARMVRMELQCEHNGGDETVLKIISVIWDNIWLA